MPDGWSKIQAFGNSLPRAWPGLPKPGREEAKAILWAYLDAIRLENGRVNEGYLRSLGMRVP
jgi:hypothetical protein